jgi:hypothetical protein
MLLNRTGGVVWALKPPKSHPWALVHKTTYAPMIYTALCVCFRCGQHPLLGQVGGGRALEISHQKHSDKAV